MHCMAPAFSQSKHHKTKAATGSKQFTEFNKLVADAGAVFTYPKGFKEIKVPDSADFDFDYAMELPYEDFEIWFQVKSLKANWANYKGQNTQANPDSLYNRISEATAIALTGDKDYYVRAIPADMLLRYNADLGKSYLLTLLDMPATRHYKYALLITLQKNHTGTVTAVCFTNDKGPEFFKNINKAGNCFKFKP